MRSLNFTPELQQYVVAHCPTVNSVLPALREETAKMPHGNMQIGHDQGAFMAAMVATLGATRILEVGCFTGYSAICMASAMSPGGKLITLDVSKEYTDVAQKYFAMAGLQNRIELRLAPATESMEKLLKDGNQESFDLIFIDADKENYENYYELGLKLLKPRGVILVDNVLWGASVINPAIQDEATRAIRRINDRVQNDPRVEANLLTIGDGVMFIRRRLA